MKFGIKPIFVLMFNLCTALGSPLKDPDFISSWYELTSLEGGYYRVYIPHGLGEVPVYVHVQVKSTHEPNKDFIFPGIGLPLRDDDDPLPYSGIVYLYDERNVMIAAAYPNNQERGSVVHTENSAFWEGPNKQDDKSALVRVRAWTKSSFPKPDFHSLGDPIGCQCDQKYDQVCFFEKTHNFNEYPSFVVVRTKLIDEDGSFNGFFSDAVGASHVVYDVKHVRGNGYVIYGFNTTTFRIWTDTTKYGYLVHLDGYSFSEVVTYGELEIMAWKHSSLTQTLEHEVQLGAVPGSYFEMETKFNLNSNTDTDSIIGVVWAESKDGDNKGFRFPGTGGMAYTTSRKASPCCYGGLTYAYTNTTLRVWKPGSVEFGKVICIADMFAAGKYSQGSNNATALLKIWTVSSLGYACNNAEDCANENSECINGICECKSGFFESLSQCRKEFACSDEVPVIPEIERRQRNIIVNHETDSKNPVDDSFITESWYTAFTSGAQWLMPDSQSVPVEGACGSINPVYIQGIHPSTESLTEEDIEVKVQTLKNDNSTYIIKIRQCGQSVQYRLKPLMIQSFVFCIDSPLVQEQKNFEEAPTQGNIGALSVGVDLLYDEHEVQTNQSVKRYEPYLVFHCEADSMGNITEQVYFTTFWFINGNLFKADGPSVMISELTEHNLLDQSVNLGFDIFCGVQLSKSTTGYKTEMVESKTFYAGIKFQSRSIALRKGETATVAFQPTVPIGCVYSDELSDKCYKNVFLKPQRTCEDNTLIAVQTQSLCGTRMKTLKNGEVWEAQPYEFNFTTIDNNYNDEYALRLQLLTDAVGHRIWRSYQLENINVQVTYSDDIKYKVCYSHVDPHQRTADGYLYEHQFEGEYILYRNTKYAVDVQMKTTICNKGRAYCACAVAVRAGGDVFVINLCAGSKFIGFTSCTDNGILEVKQKSQFRYKVYTPIGTYIDILIRPHPKYYNLMNIDIYMAPKDIQATEGLCGFFDNNMTNDLRKRDSLDFYPTDNSRGRHTHSSFSNEWKIQSRDINYLNLSNKEPVPRWETTTFCTCSQSEDGEPISVCSPSFRVACPTQDTFNEDVKCLTYALESESNERRRRFALSTKDESNTRNNIRRKRDVSETEAIAICRDVISNSTAVNEFMHRLVDIDIEGVIQECSYDVAAEDDESWAAVYPDSLTHLIQSFNEKEPVYVLEHEEEIIKFISMSCPMNCNRRGICSVNGHCQCTNGYFGPDCSLDKSDPLTIDDIYGDGFCDLSDASTCSCFTIQTIGLFDKFVCNITKTEILVNGSVEINIATLLNGSYQDIFNGMCCVSEASQRRELRSDAVDTFITQYDITISNDATTFGNSRTITVYDSRCQDINMSDIQNVLLKNHTCFIGGQCKAENETAENDECLSCVPDIERYTWTPGCEESDESKSRLLLIVILSGLGGICILIVVANRCVRYQRRSKRHAQSEQIRRQLDAGKIDSAF